MTMKYQLVVAHDRKTRGIGAKGQLMWHIPDDLAYFRALTTKTYDPARKNAVVMGRITRESIGKDLPGRHNIVISSSGAFKSLDEGLEAAQALGAESIFVIGGEALFREALASPLCAAVHVTEVVSSVELDGVVADRFFPTLDVAEWAPWGADTGFRTSGQLRYRRASFVRSSTLDFRMPPAALPHQEEAYLTLVSKAINTGLHRVDRTGTGTRSLFGEQIRFSLRDGALPLLTTKRVFTRGVVEELLWFVRGCTDARELASKGVHIWDANAKAFAATAAFAKHKEVGVDVEEGVLGPVYGHQWRHFGAPYQGRGGVDQLAEVVRMLRNEPFSRRIMLSAWNPVDLSAMALPPCHVLAQFWVNDEEVSCMVTMRSCDLGLGLPFNIASYAMLVHMVATLAELKVGDLVFSLGDAHVYEDHVTALSGQVDRSLRPMPRLVPLTSLAKLEEYTPQHFVVNGYNPHPAVAMAMSV